MVKGLTDIPFNGKITKKKGWFIWQKPIVERIAPIARNGSSSIVLAVGWGLVEHIVEIVQLQNAVFREDIIPAHPVVQHRLASTLKVVTAQRRIG
jgi:hypothetical protein